MTSKTTNKFSSEVRARAVRMVLDHANSCAMPVMTGFRSANVDNYITFTGYEKCGVMSLFPIKSMPLYL
jgi:hypothetical protein